MHTNIPIVHLIFMIYNQVRISFILFLIDAPKNVQGSKSDQLYLLGTKIAINLKAFKEKSKYNEIKKITMVAIFFCVQYKIFHQVNLAHQNGRCGPLYASPTVKKKEIETFF